MGHRTLIEFTDTKGRRRLYYAHWGSPYRVYGALADWLADADLSHGARAAETLPVVGLGDSGLEIEPKHPNSEDIAEALANPDGTDLESVYQIHIDPRAETAAVAARHRSHGQPWSEPVTDHHDAGDDRAYSVHQRCADHHAEVIAAIVGRYGPQDPETWLGKQLAHHQHRRARHQAEAQRDSTTDTA